MKRTHLMLGLGALVLGLAFISVSRTDALSSTTSTALDQTAITMFKAPSCVCCVKWGEYASANGFEVTSRYRGDMALVKQELGVPGDLISCHTSVVAGYVVEGHVPTDAIEKLMLERPNVLGIAVAGMPAGSPGMESDRPQPYNVFAFDASGRRYIFDRY